MKNKHGFSPIVCETNKRWSEDRHELEKAAKAPGVEENEKLLGTEGDGCGVQPVVWGLRTRKLRQESSLAFIGR